MRYNHSPNKTNTKPRTRKLRKKPLAILVGILLASNFLWFVAWVVSEKSWKTGEEVASVDGESIKRETWMVAMEKEIGRETLLDLVNNKVMEVAAKKNKIRVSDKEIDLELALMHAVNNQASTGIGKEKELQNIRTSIILEKLLTKDIVITDEAIESYYNENASLYNIAKAYRTSIIVLASKAEVEQVLSELAGGSSFNILARERSIDVASKNLGGDIGYVNETRDDIDKAIIAAASSMKPETTSDVIALTDGTYAIVNVNDVLKGQSFKLKEVKDHIKRELALKELPEPVSVEAFWEAFDVKWFYGE